MNTVLTLLEAATYLRIHPVTLRNIVTASKQAMERGDPPLIQFSQASEHAHIYFQLQWLDEYLTAWQPSSCKPRKPKKTANGTPLATPEEAGLPKWV